MFTVKPSQVIGCLSTILHIDSYVGVSNPMPICVYVCEWGFVRSPFMPAFQSLQQGPQGILTCKSAVVKLKCIWDLFPLDK